MLKFSIIKRTMFTYIFYDNTDKQFSIQWRENNVSYDIWLVICGVIDNFIMINQASVKTKLWLVHIKIILCCTYLVYSDCWHYIFGLYGNICDWPVHIFVVDAVFLWGTQRIMCITRDKPSLCFKEWNVFWRELLLQAI